MSQITAETILNALKVRWAETDAFVHSLNRQPSVLEVADGCHLRNYESGPVVEAYVDAELKNGRSLAWWLEVSRQDGIWILENEFLTNDSSGQTTLERFPEQDLESASDLTDAIGRALSTLVAFDRHIEALLRHSEGPVPATAAG